MSTFSRYILILLAASFAMLGCKENKSTPEPGYDPEAKLKELNITLPSPPQPVANYVNGVETGNYIFLAGKVRATLMVERSLAK